MGYPDILRRTERLTSWLRELGIEHTVRGRSSQYIVIDVGAEYITIRISDHPQPVDSNGRVTGGFFVDALGFADRREPAHLSVHPGGATVTHAKALVRRKLGARYNELAAQRDAAKAKAAAAKSASFAWEIAEIRERLATLAEDKLDAAWHPDYPTAGTVRDVLHRRLADLIARGK